jgi:hypothetical protein
LSIPRRVLLKLAGGGLAAAPLVATAAAPEGGAPPAVTPSSAIWTEFFKGQRIWAYLDRHGIAPGESFNVMAAGGPGQAPRPVRLEVFRIGATGPVPVWQSDFVTVPYRGATASAAAIGPGWPPSWTVANTQGWAPGCYYADIVEQTTATRDVKAFSWIVTNPRRSGRVLCRLGVATYQAYNPWGGHSLYPNDDDEARGLIVSFDRPTPPSFFEYDVYLVQWLEGLAGLGGVDYASNFDVHYDPSLVDRYPLVITSAHDEYWSDVEFSAFERRIFKLGRNTVFFGANTAYCQVRYGDLNRPPAGVDQGRQLVCYKTGSDPIAARVADARLLTTNNFRTGGRRPETQLLGGAYQNWFEPASTERPAFMVARTDLPFFAGTGWKVGDTAAEVVGYEWDNRDPDGNGLRLLAPSVSGRIDPASVQVLFRGQAVGADGQTGLAESTYFTSSAGAKVFNAASVRWAWGLGKDGYVNAPFQRFNENLVRALSSSSIP